MLTALIVRRVIHHHLLLFIVMIAIAACAPSVTNESATEPICNPEESIVLGSSIVIDEDRTTLDAQVLWHLTENRPRAMAYTGAPNSRITASTDQVAYLWNSPGSSCEQDVELIGFDIQTGEIAWRLYDPNLLSVFHRIVAINDGYLMLSDDRVLSRLNNRGEIVWRNGNFPSRSIETVYLVDDRLYLPSYDRVFVVSAADGVLLRTAEINNLLDGFADRVITGPGGENRVFISDLDGIEVVAFRLPDSAFIQWAASEIDPVSAHQNSVSLFFNNPHSPTRIDAFDNTTGAALWSQDIASTTLPLVVNERVYVYGINGLLVYDLYTGEQLGAVKLERLGNGLGQPSTNVWLAGFENTIIIFDRSSWEIVAVQIAF